MKSRKVVDYFYRNRLVLIGEKVKISINPVDTRVYHYALGWKYVKGEVSPVFLPAFDDKKQGKRISRFVRRAIKCRRYTAHNMMDDQEKLIRRLQWFMAENYYQENRAFYV